VSIVTFVRNYTVNRNNLDTACFVANSTCSTCDSELNFLAQNDAELGSACRELLFVKKVSGTIGVNAAGVAGVATPNI